MTGEAVCANVLAEAVAHAGTAPAGVLAGEMATVDGEWTEIGVPAYVLFALGVVHAVGAVPRVPAEFWLRTCGWSLRQKLQDPRSQYISCIKLVESRTSCKWTHLARRMSSAARIAERLLRMMVG